MRGVAEVAEESTTSARTVLRLKEKCSEKLYSKDGGNSNCQRLLNCLFGHPFIQRNEVIEHLSISNPTAGRIPDAVAR